MSYLTFTPDVRPVPVDQYVPPRSSAVRWLIALLAYLALVAGWLWWMTLPMKIQPALATIPLPDGTELRLVHITRGSKIDVDFFETFGERVRIPEERYGGSMTLSAPRESTWLVFTHFNPRTQHFSSPNISGIWIEEADPPFLHRIVPAPDSNQMPWQAYYVDVAPRRGPAWKVKINCEKMTVEATIPNPYPASNISEFTAQPLPQKVTLDGATIELLGIEFRKHHGTFASERMASPRLKFTMAGLEENALFPSYEFFDASGNITSEGVLPFSEPAWGLRARATQVKFTAAAPGEVILLGETTAPGPSEILTLPVPPVLAAQGVTDLVLIGAGNYAISKDGITTPGPDKISRTTKLATTGVLYSMNVRAPFLFTLSSKRVENRSRSRSSFSTSSSTSSRSDSVGGMVYQLHDGVKGFRAWSSGSATRTEDRAGFSQTSEFRGFDFSQTGSDKLKPGTKMRLELVKPRTIEATFYFPAPAPPK